MKKNPTFGEFIRLTRKEKRKLPLVGLSKQIGISPAQLQRIEENRVRIYPDEKFLDKLCKALDVDYETLVDLLYHHKAKRPDTSPDLKEVPVIPWEFLSNIQNISPETIAKGHIPVQTTSGEHAVAVTCRTAKWQPFIAENDVVVLLINTNPEDKDLVISAIGENEYEMLRVAKQGKELVYFPAFPAFQQAKSLSENDNQKIIGVVDQVVRRYRHS